jgi:predicted phosphohydrolase
VSIWAIADIHASRTDPDTGRPLKPMDVFGEQWENHLARIELAWRNSVAAADTVIVAGDTDWALHYEDATETLQRIDSWPGQKVILRGNHDYWWSSKTTSKVRRRLPPSMHALHNDTVVAEDFNICGAKGSPVPGGIDWTEQDAKLLNRERERLLLSLGERDERLPTLVALHYPPFYAGHADTVYRSVLEEAGVSCCVYGHLHGAAASSGFQGRYGTVEYRLVAADALGFRPALIAKEGKIVGQEERANVG